MKQDIPSSTALTTSLIRAHHSRLDPAPLIHDLWGDRLVPDSFRSRLYDWANKDRPIERLERSPERLDRYLSELPSYASVIFRARYAEDALAAAVAKGVRQYVQIGAGFDSYALRRAETDSDVAVFEIDHPATQQCKLTQLAECGVDTPEPVHFIGADLAEESLEHALRRSPFRFDEPAFFSWLGVTVYLTREANLASLMAIAKCGAAGSSLVFTYTDEEGLRTDRASGAFQRMKRNLATLGEPFLCGFDPRTMADVLAAAGLDLREDLAGIELARRYERPAVAPMIPSAYSRSALAAIRRVQA